jgi:hypothetical protein
MFPQISRAIDENLPIMLTTNGLPLFAAHLKLFLSTHTQSQVEYETVIKVAAAREVDIV